MAFVVTGRCIDCRYTDCVEVCPCDCFFRLDSPAMLVINPLACIDCFACMDACPVRAIYQDTDVPDVYESFIELNATRWSEGQPIGHRIETIAAVSLEDVKAHERSRGLGEVEDPG